MNYHRREDRTRPQDASDVVWGRVAERLPAAERRDTTPVPEVGFVPGGQMPLHRRLPKRGFANIFGKNIAVINIRDLARFDKGTMVDEVALVEAGLVKGKRDGIKLLGQGEIKHSLDVKVDLISKSAREKIEAVGGKVEVI